MEITPPPEKNVPSYAQAASNPKRNSPRSPQTGKRGASVVAVSPEAPPPTEKAKTTEKQARIPKISLIQGEKAFESLSTPGSSPRTLHISRTTRQQPEMQPLVTPGLPPPSFHSEGVISSTLPSRQQNRNFANETVSELWKEYYKFTDPTVHKEKLRLDAIDKRLCYLDKLINTREMLLNLDKNQTDPTCSYALGSINAIYSGCFFTTLFALKGLLMKAKNEAQGTANPDKETWLEIYNRAWLLRNKTLSSRGKNPRFHALFIADNKLMQLDNFLGHILAGHVIKLIFKENRGATETTANLLYVWRNYYDLIRELSSDPEQIFSEIIMKTKNAVNISWPNLPSRYTYDHLLKVFKYFDNHIYKNRDMLTPEYSHFSHINFNAQLSETIDKAMTLSLNQEQASEIVNLCKKFSSEGWASTNKIKELEQWIKNLTGQPSMKTQDDAIDNISFVGAVKKKVKRTQLTMNPDISGKKCPQGTAEAQVVRQSGFISKKQQHKTVITPRLTQEENPVITSMSASPYEYLFDQIAFNPFTNKGIQHLIPSRERLENILENGNIFYHQLLQELQERKEVRKEELNQQLIAREWLDILTSNPLLLEALNSDEKKQCAIIINIATERLLDKLSDLQRDQPDAYPETVKEETALLQNIQTCLQGLSNANIEVHCCLRTRSKVIKVRTQTILPENMVSQATNRETLQLSQILPLQKDGDKGICQSAIGTSPAQPASFSWAAIVKKALPHNEEKSTPIKEVKSPFSVSYQASPPQESCYPDPTDTEIWQFMFKKPCFYALRACFKEINQSSPEATERQRIAAFNWLQSVLIDKETLWRNLLIETYAQDNRCWCMVSLTRLVHWTLALTVDSMDNNLHRNYAQFLKEVIAFIPIISSLDKFIDFMYDPECYTDEEEHQYYIIDKILTEIHKLRNKIHQEINNLPLSPSSDHILDNELYCHQILRHFPEGSAQKISSKAHSLLQELLQESPEKRSLTNKKHLPELILRLFSIGLNDLKQKMLAVSSGRVDYSEDQVLIQTNQLNKALIWLSSCQESLPVDIGGKLDQLRLELTITGGLYTSLLPPTVLSQINVLFNENKPDLGAVCTLLKTGIFLNFNHKAQTLKLLESIECSNQIKNMLRLMKALACLYISQNSLTPKEASSVVKIVNFVSQCSPSLINKPKPCGATFYVQQGTAIIPVESLQEKSRPSDLPPSQQSFQNGDDIIDYTHLITYLREYSRKKNQILDKRVSDNSTTAATLKDLCNQLAEVGKHPLQETTTDIKQHYEAITTEYKTPRELSFSENIPEWVKDYSQVHYELLYVNHVMGLIEAHLMTKSVKRYRMEACARTNNLIQLSTQSLQKLNFIELLFGQKFQRFIAITAMAAGNSKRSLQCYKNLYLMDQPKTDDIIYTAYHFKHMRELTLSIVESFAIIKNSFTDLEEIKERISGCLDLSLLCTKNLASHTESISSTLSKKIKTLEAEKKDASSLKKNLSQLEQMHHEMTHLESLLDKKGRQIGI